MDWTRCSAVFPSWAPEPVSNGLATVAFASVRRNLIVLMIRVKTVTGFVLRFELVNMEYEIGTGEPVSTAVVRAVSVVVGDEPGSIPRLAHVLAPDALDSLFEPQSDGAPRSGGRLSFVYCQCHVTIENGEYLTVRPLDSYTPDDRRP